jgi:hypothetical protein
MNRFIQLFFVSILILVHGCTQKTDFLPEIKEQFQQGNFADVEKLIIGFKSTGLPDSVAFEIEILEAFWDFDFDGPDDVVPPLLVYADLLATMDPRNFNVGQMILDQQR